MGRLEKFEEEVRTSEMAYKATGGADGTSRSGKPIELYVPAQHEVRRPNKRMRIQRWLKYQENNPGAPIPPLEESPDVEMTEANKKSPDSSESRPPLTLAETITRDKAGGGERGGDGDEGTPPAAAKTRTRSRSSKIHDRQGKGKDEKGEGTARERERRGRSRSNKIGDRRMPGADVSGGGAYGASPTITPIEEIADPDETPEQRRKRERTKPRRSKS